MKTHQSEIRAQQIAFLSEHIIMVLVGSIIFSSAIVLVFRNQFPAYQLAGWLIVFLITLLFRGLVARGHRADPDRAGNSAKWGQLFTLASGLVGLSWAGAAILFYEPTRPELVLFLAFMYAGLVAGATAYTSVHLPTFIAFLIPTTIPFAIMNLFAGGAMYNAMGITIFAFAMMAIVYARKFNLSIAGMYKLQCENADLLRDLEQQKRAADTSRDIAENAIREKNSFLAAASHDLRQPLHASGLLLSVLRDHVQEKEGHALLDSVFKSIEALNHLFNSLLDVSRLDAGVIEVHPRHISMSDLIHSIESKYRLQAEKKHLEVNLQCGATAVYTDPVLLERILSNLMSNAITYTKQGSVSIRCSQTSKDKVLIEISDTGVGIPEAETSQIFSEYYQINNPERDRSKGLGLGLAIVKRLCELMEINIELRSVTGEHTTFSLELPSGDPEKIQEEKKLPYIASLSGVVVLVIDDDQDVLSGMQKLLSAWGCKTLAAKSAETALRVLSQHDKPPEIVFADYRLCDNKTGVEAIHAVFEELNRSIPAVIITGDTSPERLRQVNSSGFRLLHKPVTPVELRATLQQEIKIAQD